MSATEIQATKAKEEAEQPAQRNASPRKRRRRAPATGAAADCFACQERHTKCDRRRPYCTPCLDQGKDCSGYKTQLTWGVGVASRGKLRGLALPIAKSKKAVQGDDQEDAKTSEPQKPVKLGTKRRASDSVGSTQLRSPMSASTSGSSDTPTTYNFVNMDPNSSSSTTSPMHAPPSFDWREPSSHSQTRDIQPPRKKARRHTLQPLQVPTMHPTRDYGTMPMTASIIGGYGHHDFGLSSQISPLVPSFTGYGVVSPTYKGFTLQPMFDSSCETNFFPGHETFGWPRDDMSSLSSDQSNQDYRQHETFYADLVGANSMGHSMSAQQTFPQQDLVVTSGSDNTVLMADNKYPGFAHQAMSLVPDDVGDHSSLSVPRLLPSLSIGNTPKLQFLIDYYDKVISPVIVAFDGPTNPYRSHILSLAVESETLQHAIAALSASNLRMRRGHNPLAPSRSSQSITPSSHDHSVRKSSIAHSLMDAGMDRLPQTSVNEPSNEELYHKNTSINSLNEQLSDPHRRKDDSILATLLILCLYHICDTGVGKFKTQFSGVKKILALRGGTKGNNSKATNWLTIMFTWFDAMTATINDREGQFDGDDLDMSKLKSDEWALENLAGCDGRLFKIIAKLGRLNLLSQNKPVSDRSPRSSTSPMSKPPKLPSPGPKTQDYYSMTFNRFDGNGWSAMIDEEPTETDTRAQFWKEWNDIRQRLTDWQLDDSVSLPRESDQRDLYHISESFRYSALLYTERLAFPQLPSTHPNFQNLVTQALFHISNVKSDVFLLWPLFITGTECVSEQSRYLIRERCMDLQKDSGFFNNISGLEVLEKIWRDDDTIDEPTSEPAPGLALPSNELLTIGGHGFKWRKAMERVDGEYIVV
ncbi:hypothetical protein ABVK25_003914 [Lepraria finkii]|uniref:Zn(2)-C6 fungal-type domain-containing protein n=1 Tax=Lepraria finkii TaxID=1340010 RepID=A0ABR4BCV8_9LECA